MTVTRLFKNDYFTLLSHQGLELVEVVRSSVPFPSAHAAAVAFAPLLIRLDDLGRERHALLLDSRDAVANNDPGYEASYARFRTDLHRGFRKIAILVRTSAGNLQANRLVPPVDSPVRVFQDRDVAWAFLTKPITTPPPSLRGNESQSRKKSGAPPLSV